MNAPLMQTNSWQAVHEEFQRGGAFWEVFWVLFAITAGLAALVLYQRIQQNRSSGHVSDHPGKLFRVVITRLRLGVLQRDLLRRMARELQLVHPTVLLLSPEIFHEQAQQWLDGMQFNSEQGSFDDHRAARQRDSLDDLCHAIFGVRLRSTDSNPGVSERTPGRAR